MKRPNRRAAALATVAVLTIAAFVYVPVATATFPGRSSLIAFHSNVDGGVQIFTSPI